ncbi:MAG TPA: hypothetical protein VK815_09155 [Candidatus Acidoferrales bacterium]|jgi:hypothetical protein|nr:hypothetical protein [Candidatus Acidoferrales bacterium]
MSLAAIAIIVLAVKIAIFLNAPRMSAGDSTWNTLRQIDSAKQQWMLEKGKTPDDIPTWNELLPYIGSYMTNFHQTNGVVVDPRGGIFFIGKVSQPAAAKKGEKIYP